MLLVMRIVSNMRPLSRDGEHQLLRTELSDLHAVSPDGGVGSERTKSAICLDPPPGELAEPITLRDKLACVWKQLLAAPSQISVAVDLRSVTK
jgi:hypothetical protein